MENIISKEQLEGARKRERFFSSLNESVSARKRNAYHGEVTVFLSHNHRDKDVLENVIGELKSLGVNVYVDWNDEFMPYVTSGETARRIKEKIRNSKKFILIATEAAIASKWCNWELGYGDAYKYRDHIAIMPIKESRDRIYTGSEYLQIYPIITNEYQYSIGNYYVEYQDTKISLKDWLQR